MINGLSLRGRLLLAVGAIALVALIVADFAVYASLKSYLYRQADTTLGTSNQAVEIAVTRPDLHHQSGPAADPLPGQPPQAANFCALARNSAPGMFIEVINPTNSPVSGEKCPAFTPGGRQYSPKLPTVISGFTTDGTPRNQPTTYFTVVSTTSGGPLFRVIASKLPNGSTIVISDPVSDIANTLNQLLLVEVLVTSGALIGAVLLGLWLVRVGLRPLRDVVRTAEAISGGDLMHRVPNANAKTEVGHVAMAFNVMVERIQSAFDELQTSENRLRQFVSDASHELRTPIAAVSAYAQLFHQGAENNKEDLPRVMEGIERETSRMARLVEDLLVLARLDEQTVVDHEPVELVGLVIEAIETAQTVGPLWPIHFAADQPVEILGDGRALRRVVDNLLGNVRAHTPPGTNVTIRVGLDGHVAFIEVADDGPGMSDDDASSAFERFFRADTSRSRETGGAGLGLAIVATIMRVHGGSATATSRPGGGATFIVRLPALEVTEREEG